MRLIAERVEFNSEAVKKFLGRREFITFLMKMLRECKIHRGSVPFGFEEASFAGPGVLRS